MALLRAPSRSVLGTCRRRGVGWVTLRGGSGYPSTKRVVDGTAGSGRARGRPVPSRGAASPLRPAWESSVPVSQRLGHDTVKLDLLFLGAHAPPLADDRDRSRLGALIPLLRLVGHLPTVGQALEAIAQDRAVMDEQVLAAIVRGNEPKPLGVVEPLHGSSCHVTPPLATQERVRKARAQPSNVRQRRQPSRARAHRGFLATAVAAGDDKWTPIRWPGTLPALCAVTEQAARSCLAAWAGKRFPPSSEIDR